MTAAVDAAGVAGGSFDDLRPGPALTAALQGDPTVLEGEGAAAGMVAAFRADNHAAWARCRWLWEACRSRAGSTARGDGGARAALVAAAAFGWSGAMAAARLEFARQVLVRLPALGEAMRAGWLEEPRAALFVSTLRELDDAQARLVVERLLGQAARWPHGELSRRIEKAAADVDPAWHEARRAAAVARARVIARSAPSGAAELSGVDLPEDDALLAYNHVVAIADAVRAAVRARGGDVGQGFAEAHVYLALLKPDLLGADDTTVVASLVGELLQPRRPDDDGSDDDGSDEDGLDDDGPDDDGPDDDGPDDDGPDDGGSEDGGSEDGPEDGGPAGGETTADAHDDDGPDCDAAPDDSSDDGSDHDPGDAAPEDPGPEAEPEAAPLAFRAGVAVRLELTTLLGLDRRPGDVPGFGVVAGSTARHLARTRPGAATRLLLFDPDGNLEYALTLHPRGGRAAQRRSRHRREVIEVLARTATVDALDAHDLLGLEATLLTRAKTALAAVRARPPDEHPAVTGADAHRRHPGTDLDTWVRARDRTCRFPGCTRPAMRADLDHTLDWLLGGLTEAGNLGALCEPHHLLKHDPESGWTVCQPSPGHFVWTSPTGVRHHVEPERYQEPFGPLTPADGPASIPDLVFAPPPRSSPAWAPRPNRHGYVTDAARAAAARLARAGAPDDAPPVRDDDDPDF